MAIKNAQKRYHADAIRAANMDREGSTTREIASVLEKKPEQIKKMVLLGQRLQDAPPSPNEREE